MQKSKQPGGGNRDYRRTTSRARLNRSLGSGSSYDMLIYLEKSKQVVLASSHGPHGPSHHGAPFLAGGLGLEGKRNSPKKIRNIRYRLILLNKLGLCPCVVTGGKKFILIYQYCRDKAFTNYLIWYNLKFSTYTLQATMLAHRRSSYSWCTPDSLLSCSHYRKRCMMYFPCDCGFAVCSKRRSAHDIRRSSRSPDLTFFYGNGGENPHQDYI